MRLRPTALHIVTNRLTDRQTDGQHYYANSLLYSAVCATVRMYDRQKEYVLVGHWIIVLLMKLSYMDIGFTFGFRFGFLLFFLDSVMYFISVQTVLYGCTFVASLLNYF